MAAIKLEHGLRALCLTPELVEGTHFHCLCGEKLTRKTVGTHFLKAADAYVHEAIVERDGKIQLQEAKEEKDKHYPNGFKFETKDTHMPIPCFEYHYRSDNYLFSTPDLLWPKATEEEADKVIETLAKETKANADKAMAAIGAAEEAAAFAAAKSYKSYPDSYPETKKKWYYLWLK